MPGIAIVLKYISVKQKVKQTDKKPTDRSISRQINIHTHTHTHTHRLYLKLKIFAAGPNTMKKKSSCGRLTSTASQAKGKNNSQNKPDIAYVDIT